MKTAPLLPIPSDPSAAVRHLVRIIGPGFHPDTPAAEYIAGDSGAPSLSPAEVSAIDAARTAALGALGGKIYSVALEAFLEFHVVERP